LNRRLKMAQSPSFMGELSKRDSEFFELLSAIMAKACETDTLDRATKSLITLAVDAAGGSK